MFVSHNSTAPAPFPFIELCSAVLIQVIKVMHVFSSYFSESQSSGINAEYMGDFCAIRRMPLLWLSLKYEEKTCMTLIT
eukprot:NODE_2102_length_640_cov_192.470389_g1652_i0.p2 GENE.NODE_2102_length_640_cov_192.470389_g1652_i0~~NODE_2102_length_640_cov_192.470389_g1652_i0.p2  ORF type:complete len:79 (-),score=9.75 NODE_2102_length_640_cov_192.470389_g1652_i0:214-450(-)